MIDEMRFLDAQAMSEAKFRSFNRSFEKNWNKNTQDQIRAKIWRGLDGTMKDKLRAASPVASADLDKRYGGQYGNRK